MTRSEILQLVSDSLSESQRMSGRNEVIAVSEATIPIGDLAGFDSLNAIEVTQVLEDRLGRPLPENLFTDEGTQRPVSVAAVVDRLLQIFAEVRGN